MKCHSGRQGSTSADAPAERERRRAPRQPELHRGVHRVETQALAVVHQDAAGIVAADDGVARVLLPVDEVVGDREARRPRALPLRVGVRVVDAVVAAAVAHDLVERHGVPIVGVRTEGDDGLVPHVRPHSQVLRGGQPDALVVALVVEVEGPPSTQTVGVPKAPAERGAPERVRMSRRPWSSQRKPSAEVSRCATSFVPSANIW